MELNRFDREAAQIPLDTKSMESWPPALVQLWWDLKTELLALGPDVTVTPRTEYTSFWRKDVFAYVKPVPKQDCIVMSVKVNPDTVKLESGFTRDVRAIRAIGWGDLEIIIYNHRDLEKAKPILMESYTLC